MITVYRPNDYDHTSQLDETARREIDALNEDMKSAGVTVFVGGLRSINTVQCVRKHHNGDIVISKEPYLNATDFVDGFWILECADIDEALDWAKKAALSCRATIEVRPFY